MAEKNLVPLEIYQAGWMTICGIQVYKVVMGMQKDSVSITAYFFGLKVDKFCLSSVIDKKPTECCFMDRSTF